MTQAEQRTFLRAVMIVGANPEAELAAQSLAALEKADTCQSELLLGLRAAAKPQNPLST